MTHLCHHCQKPFRKSAAKWQHIAARHPQAQAKLDAKARLSNVVALSTAQH